VPKKELSQEEKERLAEIKIDLELKMMMLRGYAELASEAITELKKAFGRAGRDNDSQGGQS
jgi:hypothetical protein